MGLDADTNPRQDRELKELLMAARLKLADFAMKDWIQLVPLIVEDFVEFLQELPPGRTLIRCTYSCTCSRTSSEGPRAWQSH